MHSWSGAKGSIIIRRCSWGDRGVALTMLQLLLILILPRMLINTEFYSPAFIICRT